MGSEAVEKAKRCVHGIESFSVQGNASGVIARFTIFFGSLRAPERSDGGGRPGSTLPG